MSTTYAIVSEAGTIIVGRTTWWESGIEPLLDYLNDDTPVVALDNDTNIKTIKDLKEYYKRINE